MLVDARTPESYQAGHIPGAISFPLATMDKETAGKILPIGARVITYCTNFSCPTSTKAARKLSEFGYDVLDYKGGADEWEEKGNKLEHIHSKTIEKGGGNMISTQQVGENAGKVWHYLGKNGSVNTKELAKELSLGSEELSMALGWLARENKLSLSEKNRNIYVGLTDSEKKAYMQASHR